MKYAIDEKLANAILNYLVNRPYIEVANIIHGMNTMEPLPEISPACAQKEGIPPTGNG